jgi:hypothetical protein
MYVVFMENMIDNCIGKTFIFNDIDTDSLTYFIRSRYNIPPKFKILIYTHAQGIIGRKLVDSVQLPTHVSELYVYIR